MEVSFVPQRVILTQCPRTTSRPRTLPAACINPERKPEEPAVYLKAEIGPVLKPHQVPISRLFGTSIYALAA